MDRIAPARPPRADTAPTPARDPGFGPDENVPLIGCGKALLDLVVPASARAVFFDPQYRGVLDHLALGNEGARQKGRAGLAQMPTPLIAEMIAASARTLAPSGYLFLWLDKFHLCEGTDDLLATADLRRVDLVTWDKGRIGMGHRSRRRCEYLLVLQKPPLRAKATWRRHDIPDVWQERVPRKGHPHTKPTGLLTALCEAVTDPGDLVIDPAAGSFATLRALAALPGRRFLGADLVDHTGEGRPLAAPGSRGIDPAPLS